MATTTVRTSEEIEAGANGGVMERRRAAAAPTTSPETLARLATDPHLLVRKNVALNPSTPEETLLLLAGDPDVVLRVAVARNKSVSQAVAELLSRDEAHEVRVTLADNEHTPFAVLAEMTRTEQGTIRNTAFNTLANVKRKTPAAGYKPVEKPYDPRLDMNPVITPLDDLLTPLPFKEVKQTSPKFRYYLAGDYNSEALTPSDGKWSGFAADLFVGRGTVYALRVETGTAMPDTLVPHLSGNKVTLYALTPETINGRRINSWVFGSTRSAKLAARCHKDGLSPYGRTATYTARVTAEVGYDLDASYKQGFTENKKRDLDPKVAPFRAPIAA